MRNSARRVGPRPQAVWHLQNADAIRSILVDCDVQAARQMWGEVDDVHILTMIHLARTAANSIPLKLRAYSHRWLLDHGLPSQLPDRLKPKAERMYPQPAKAVGIAVLSKFPEVVTEVRSAMENAVHEAEADGKLNDSPFVKGRMLEARAKARKILFG